MDATTSMDAGNVSTTGASTFQAAYFDGRSSRKHVVTLDLADGTIVLHGLDAPKTYALQQARLAEPFAGAPCVLDLDDGARLEVAREAYPLLMQLLRRPHSMVERWQQHWQGAVAAVVLLVVAVVGMAKWGVPMFAETIVAGMPVSVDQQLGDSTEEMLEGRLFYRSKLSPQRIAQVRAIFEQVRPAKGRLPFSFKVMRMRGDTINAVALPNGTIIMSDAMVTHVLDQGKASQRERHAQLAGVLAHEIGHIEGRHGMRAVTRGSLMAAGSAALFGDFSAVAAGVPAILLNMDYSRDMERAADDYAIRRLRELGLPATPLANLFESLEKAARMEGKTDGKADRKEDKKQDNSRGDSDAVSASDYFSSHPATSERSARFRAADFPP